MAETDDTVYIAVGKDVREQTLLWALDNFRYKKFCVLHIDQPPKNVEPRESLSSRRRIINMMLDEYLLICVCRQAKIAANKICIKRDDVGKGIIELICQHSINKLVMGAAADKHYSEGMKDVRSNKAKYIQQHMPYACRVWFICNGRLIVKSKSKIAELLWTEPLGDLPSASEQRTEVNDLLNSKEGSSIDLLYSQLELALVEVGKHKREALEESLRLDEAEKTSIKALFLRAKALESLYTKELKRGKEYEESLAKEKKTLERTKHQLKEAQAIATDLDNKIKGLLIEKNNLQILAEKLAKKQAEDASESQMYQFLSVFSLSEIKEATRNFDLAFKIGEGGYGNIYRGNLRKTEVAIKVLNKDSLQGPSEFTQEVRVLSKIRHPNLVTLIGACSEVYALIYEYAPNGNLEDRLQCKNKTPPLSWQHRIRIATELCSALIFLHSSKPYSIVHGDIKPGNILLGSNLSCKLSDFGICRALSVDVTLRHQTDPKGTFIYMDPHFLTTGELTPKSDVYSFGIILLQLLTGRSALGIIREIRNVIDEGKLRTSLDPLAGDWPFVQAKKLARVALQCCAIDPISRADLVSEVWKVLDSYY
ncbi:U-box domain-containing protein 33-like [Mercurialis annua]|uniref:U-box domain-containing protein 33-like n=1 Tax=Mercurialis annua TaxID=3986 RepID=UPI00215F9ED2|nr:U-box domain-containing protein 33-like [Mercurialis annua]